MALVENPILRCFNPDPCITRAGDDYYIATSTFEWYPGVQIHHSKDLVNWKVVKQPLECPKHFNMAGIGDSAGIWAPCLSYHDGTFFLVYTVMTTIGQFKCSHNYLTTATDVEGEWSEPVYIDSNGFDASLFHDDDGRKYYMSMTWDYRAGRNKFGGILLQEYDYKNKKLIGEMKNIFKGALGKTEGPHIYKHGGYYYLMTAEGGTGASHATSVCRSKSIWGPYEVAPNNPILTTADDRHWPLQRAGHSSIVEGKNGDWYLVHLCSRTYFKPEDTEHIEGRSILGRETAIQRVVWTEDGWLTLANGTNKPDVVLEIASGSQPAPKKLSYKHDFDGDKLDIMFQTLRTPNKDCIIVGERPSWLTLKGKDMLCSTYTQALVGTRANTMKFTVATKLEFAPKTFKNMAGLSMFYNTANYFYLAYSRDDDGNYVLSIYDRHRGEFGEPVSELKTNTSGLIYLKADVDFDKLQFSYSADGAKYVNVGEVLDMSMISDEYVTGGSFTGAMIALCCQDMTGHELPAYFDWLEYSDK